MGEITGLPIDDQISFGDATSFTNAQALSRDIQDNFQPAKRFSTSEQPAYLDLSLNGLYGDAYHSTQGIGTVIDYEPQEIQKGKSFALGMDYEERRDLRTSSEKLQNFISAATKNATNPENYKQYIQSEIDKLIGFAEGMNMAKEETKTGVAAGWKALTDGTVAEFLSKPNAINEPIFMTVGKMLDAMTRDPSAVNNAILHAVEGLGNAILQANDYYNKLPDRKRGHVIGHAAFVLVNPEGSTKSGEAALKIADTVATYADAAVIKTIDQSLEVMQKVSSDVAGHVKKNLYDYIQGQGLTGPQLEAAGIPRGFFNDIERAAGKGDNFFAMSQDDEGSSIHLWGAHGGGEIRYQIDKATGRLQRTDLGKVRQSYNWQAIDEHFSTNVIRQSTDDSCISAVGEMLSNGKITERELIARLGGRPDISDLLQYLGPSWTDEGKRFRSLADISQYGPWAAELIENAGTELEKSFHAVVVDGLSPAGNLIIRDPWEGTKYEMPVKHFLEDVWTGRAVYRTEP